MDSDSFLTVDVFQPSLKEGREKQRAKSSFHRFTFAFIKDLVMFIQYLWRRFSGVILNIVFIRPSHPRSS